MSDWFVNLRCKRCGRFVGTTVRGVAGDTKTVGCKTCRISTDIVLKDNDRVTIGDFEITMGYYQYDS